MTYNSVNAYNNFSGCIGGSNSKFLLSIIYFILAVTTGWALKHHNGGQYELAAYGILFVHSLLCMLRYTHPNAGNIQRIISNQSSLYAPLLFVTLIITQLLLIIDKFGNLWLAGCAICYATIILTQIFQRHTINKKTATATTMTTTFVQQLCLDMVILWHIGVLAWITILYATDCYWTAGLAILIFLNHFILWRLKLHFSITHLEVSTVGLCFTVLFTLNTMDEINDMFSIVKQRT